MPYPATQTYWLDPSGQTARAMRRYERVPGVRSGWTCEHGYHDIIVWTDRVKTGTHLDLDGTRMRDEVAKFHQEDRRWPTECVCGFVFDPASVRQTFAEEVYTRADTRADCVLPRSRNAPDSAPVASPGAMWHAYWHPSAWRGEDGISLVVYLPSGHAWNVDMRVAECELPGTVEHRCFIRHGDPRKGALTIDKHGAATCSAALGSTVPEDYHGMLSAGVLTSG